MSRYQKCVNLVVENVVTAMPWLNNHLLDKQWRTTRWHFLGALYTDSTLQVVTISVAMAPRILKLATWLT